MPSNGTHGVIVGRSSIIPRGRLIVISGPSGAGKTSLVRALMQADPRIAQLFLGGGLAPAEEARP